MAKRNSKLSKAEIEEIFYQLCLAISEIKNAKEAAEFLRDLLSYPEVEMVAKRLKIAELLINKATYEEIMNQIKVSAGTIARVQEWLNVSGEGYRNIISKIKNKKIDRKKINTYHNPENWGSLKKRYPMYYWPQIVLENIIENANIKQKKQLKSVLGQIGKMKQKAELYKKINKLLKF
jgi:TrpR-related protein YerC/YecD